MSVTAHSRDLLDKINFKPLLEKRNHDTVENLKGDLYDLYRGCPIVSGDELVEYLRSRYPSWLIEFEVTEKTNAYNETYNEYTILYFKHNQQIVTRKAFKNFVNSLIDNIDDNTLDELVNEFISNIQ